MEKRMILEKSLSLNKWTTVLTILLLAVLLTGAFICFSISSSIPQSIEKQITTSPNARMLWIIPERLTWEEHELEQLMQREHIELAFSQDELYWGNWITTDTGQVSADFFGAAGPMLPEEILLGKKEELQDYEILIPSKLTFEDGSKQKGTDLIGQTFSASINSPTYIDADTIDPSKTTQHKIEFTVVGVYDETARVYSENQLFTTTETIKQLQQLSRGNWYDYNAPNETRILFTDDYARTLALESQLKAEGYIVDAGLFFDYALLYSMQYLTAALCLVVVVFSCVLVFFLLKRNILKKAVDIGLLKIIGYEDKEILKIVAKQTVKLFLFSAILAILCYGCIYPFIDHELFFTIHLPIFSVYFIAGLCAFLLLIPSINICFLARQLKIISPIEIIKEHT